MAGIAEGRLREERRSWRKDHPIGFVARPRSKADGSTDLLNWDVVIPGKKDTMWDGCEFNLTMEFSSDLCANQPVRRVPLTLPCWLGQAARNRHRHAIEQASHRWSG